MMEGKSAVQRVEWVKTDKGILICNGYGGRYSRLSLLFLAFAILASCNSSSPTVRPKRWAHPIQRNGLPNFYQVDAGLYRGAQPDAVGIQELKRIGVKTILNLRSAHSDQALLLGSGIQEVRIPLHASQMTQSDLKAVLAVMLDPDKRPVFVHCMHGADRTGAACAAYRVVAQRWTRDDAVDELRHNGYHFHSIFRSIPRLIREFDAAAVRRQTAASLPHPSPEHSNRTP